MHVDQAGNIVITGGFTGTVEFGSTRLHADGNAGFVAKLTSDCELLWAKSFGGDPTQYLQLEAVSSDSAGNVYAGGTLRAAVNLGNLVGSPARHTPMLVKLSPNGDLLWRRDYGSLTYDGALSGIEVDSRDRLVLYGVASADTNFGGGPVAFGRVGPIAFVAVLDGEGTHVWSRSPTTLSNLDAALGPDDSVAMGGFDPMRGRTTHQLGKLDASGNEILSSALTSRLEVDRGNWEGDLDVDVEGNILFMTVYEHTDEELNVLLHDATLQKLSSSGESIWSVDLPPGGNFDTTSWDGSLASDSSGHVLYSIGFSEQTTFAGQTFDSHGDDDVLLMKFTKDGEPVWVEQVGDAAHERSCGLDADPQGNVITAYSKSVIGEFRGELWVLKLAP